MSCSKLFTPKLGREYSSVLDKTESDDPFVNPPMHADVPTWACEANGGNAANPLSLKGDGNAITPRATRRPFSTGPREDTNY